MFRFPCDNLLSLFCVLPLRPITFLQSEKLSEYDKWFKCFAALWSSQDLYMWKNWGGERENHITTWWSRWNGQGMAAAQENCFIWVIPPDIVCGTFGAFATEHDKIFPNLVMLAKLGLTLARHTARRQRIFSVQYNILTSFRSRLKCAVQQKLIQSRLGPARVNFNFKLLL